MEILTRKKTRRIKQGEIRRKGKWVEISRKRRKREKRTEVKKLYEDIVSGGYNWIEKLIFK